VTGYARNLFGGATGSGVISPLRDLLAYEEELPSWSDILSKAAAWFARETGTLPCSSSGS
jgi:hypothetical protein